MTEMNVSNLAQAAEAIEYAKSEKLRLEVVGGGSKAGLGRQERYDAVLDLSSMAGVVDYQPEELVLTLRAGTPMAEIESLLAEANQMLAFEAPDYGALLGGGKTHGGTIGGLVATNLSGPRRLTAGAARDYLLGFEAVSGRGEQFKSGGKVMKNVTGYDLSKLMCGSYGTLAVMDEITLKTLPRPETSSSLIFPAQSYAEAVRLIARLFASPHEPGSAAILPCDIAVKAGVTLDADFVGVVRLEGIKVSVNDRFAGLQAIVPGDRLEAAVSRKLWARIRDVDLITDRRCDVWKLSCAPAEAAQIVEMITARHDVDYFADWAGGLVWITGPETTLGETIRQSIAGAQSGFAMLVRDVAATRDRIAPLQPITPPLFALHKRVKAAFDPLAVLNHGRMHAGV